MSGTVIARVFLAGRPRTKGHIQPVHVRGTAGRPCRYGGGKDRPELQAWMRIMGQQIQAQFGVRMGRVAGRVQRIDAEPYAGPVEVHCFFRFDKRLSEREAAEAGEVWPSHDVPWPTATSIGDEDTLRRAVLDALVKNGVIRDDSLSVGGSNYKRWCRPGGEKAGVLVVVIEARDGESLLAAEEAWEEL